MAQGDGRRREQDEAFFNRVRAVRQEYDAAGVVSLFRQVDEGRVRRMADVLAAHIARTMPQAISKRKGLGDYRTNPYVLMTCANVMNLTDPARFADFLFNNKLYMGLETSFGKSIEAKLVGEYPIVGDESARWQTPPEKAAESAHLRGLSREARARARKRSLWREIDRSCVVGDRRYMALIKSGPNCINDTQVQAMTDAIVDRHDDWLRETRHTYPEVRQLDIIVGITYGTPRTTNNKENQILIKLLEAGFVEEDPPNTPGVLVYQATRTTRVHRRVGQGFWSFIGRPDSPEQARFVFLEVLLALARALASGMREADLETRINQRTQALASAIAGMMFPRNSLPSWVRADFTEQQLFWFATALSAFYDQGV